MSKTWLLIDCNNLLHRAWHTVGKLEHNDQPTGVIFGFLKQVKSLQSRFQTEHIAFAFDSVRSLRAKACKTYKANRKPTARSCAECSFLGDKLASQCNRCAGTDRQDTEAYGAFKKQCHALRDQHLLALGHRNIFWAKGYEADDVLASLVKRSLRPDDDAVLVSSDHDLYQLLDGTRVQMWLPHKKELYGEDHLRNEYKIRACLWPEALALAGCPGDGVIGVPKVGYKTAAKHLRGEIKSGTKVHQAIMEFGAQTCLLNLPLVTLPYFGCPRFELRNDDCSAAKWRAVCKELGFDSLLRD